MNKLQIRQTFINQKKPPIKQQQVNDTKPEQHAVIHHIGLIIDYYLGIVQEMNEKVGFRVHIGPSELQQLEFYMYPGGCTYIKNGDVMVAKFEPCVVVRNIGKYQKSFLINRIREILNKAKQDKADLLAKIKESKKRPLFKQE